MTGMSSSYFVLYFGPFIFDEWRRQIPLKSRGAMCEITNTSSVHCPIALKFYTPMYNGSSEAVEYCENPLTV